MARSVNDYVRSFRDRGRPSLTAEVLCPVLVEQRLPDFSLDDDLHASFYTTYDPKVPATAGLSEEGRMVRELDRMVIPVRKRPGGQFQDRVGVGRTRAVDVTLPHKSISKYHAYFVRDEQARWTVVDAGSRNGTWVDDVRLKPKASASIRNRSCIRFGLIRVEFLEPDEFIERIVAWSR